MIGGFLNEHQLILSAADGSQTLHAELGAGFDQRGMQIAKQWHSAGFTDTQFSLATTAHETPDRLAELLSTLDGEGCSLAAFMDSAALAAGAVGFKGVGLVLQFQRHSALVTRIVETEGRYRRAAFSVREACGWLDIRRACLQCIADRMIRQSRFDPLHDVKDEDYLAAHLLDWLKQAMEEGSVTISMTALGKPMELKISLGELINATEPIFKKIRNLVLDTRLPGARDYLLLPEWLGHTPGARECLTALSGSAAYLFDESIIARAAAHWVPPPREDDAVTLYRQVALAPFAEREIRSFNAEPSEYRAPTHLLYGSRVWQLMTSIRVGRGADCTVVLPQGVAGISRDHCTLTRLDDEWVLIDHSRYGTWINDERVRGRQRLVAGDRVRLGDPGIELNLITVSDGDG